MQISLGDLPSRPAQRGVGHRHERWDGERWTRQRPRAGVIAGRVLSIRERQGGAQTNGTEAYGEIVWSWRLSGWRQVSRRSCEPDRADKTIFARRWCQTSPITRESAL